MTTPQGAGLLRTFCEAFRDARKSFAKWADDGSLWQAFVASVAHLAKEQHLDTSVLHGDGTNTVAKKGRLGLATRATNTRKGRKVIAIIDNPWLRLSACSRGPRQRDGHYPLTFN